MSSPLLTGEIEEEGGGEVAPDPDGRLTRLLGLSLVGADPGEYSLVLRATDEATGETVARAEPFTMR